MGIQLYLLVYVNDIVVTGNNVTTINNFKNALSKRFSLKDLGLLHYFIGVEVLPNAYGLIFSQSKYISNKPLPSSSFQPNLIKLGVVDTSPNLRGTKGTISAA